jgi:PQQ-dependent catabolism-associated CXXCW motif protein
MGLKRAFAPAALLLLLSGGNPAGADEPPAEPDAYRLDDYRTPTPPTVLGRKALTTEKAEQLWRNGGAAFIDVLPAPRRPDALSPTAIWAPRPHLSIPGSTWLPDVGRGALNADLEAWFRTSLDRIAKGDRGAAVVFFCLADCWMSWNAARRALEWGYAGAQWYRDGTDAWSFAGLPLAEIAPPSDQPR